jgi:hypothetical protein
MSKLSIFYMNTSSSHCCFHGSLQFLFFVRLTDIRTFVHAVPFSTLQVPDVYLAVNGPTASIEATSHYLTWQAAAAAAAAAAVAAAAAAAGGCMTKRREEQHTSVARFDNIHARFIFSIVRFTDDKSGKPFTTAVNLIHV